MAVLADYSERLDFSKSYLLCSGVLAPVCPGRPPEKLAPPQLLTHKSVQPHNL